MRKFFCFLALSLMIDAVNAHEYAEGQVWSYKTRAGEESSTLLINKIESHPKFGNIFHISVFGIKIKNPRGLGRVPLDLPHTPVSSTTMDKSVLKLVGQSKPNPDFLGGYKEWKGVFDQGKAGIYTISVAEIVSGLEETVSQSAR